MVQPWWKSSLAGPQNVKHRVTPGPSNSTPRCIVREMKIHICIKPYALMFLATLFIIAQKRKQPDAHEWMNGEAKCDESAP